MLEYQGVTFARPAARRKSLIYNNLDRKDRNAKQEDEHHGKGFCNVCHNVLCHNVLCHTECSIVLARCAAIADSIFVSEDLADNVIESLVSFKALLRDFVAVSLQGEVRELQLIGVIERILCAEVVFAALIGEVFFVCIHVRREALPPH